MNRIIDSFDSGSNYNFNDKLTQSNAPRSAFNLSHLNTMTIKEAGALIPIALIETLPTDSFDISVRALLRVMPQVVPLYSRQRLYIHAFYSRMGDLWSDFGTFMTKGYSGNDLLSIPSVNPDAFGDEFPGFSVDTGSLAEYLGLPIGLSITSDVLSKLSALPFMMYERIYRDYYMNRNFYIDSRAWLPNDDTQFRLNSNGEVISRVNNPTAATYPELGTMRYRDFPQDYFLSALPFPQRGNTPTLDVNFSNATVQLLPAFSTPGPSGAGISFGAKLSTSLNENLLEFHTDASSYTGIPFGRTSFPPIDSTFTAFDAINGDLASSVYVGAKNGESIGTSITLNQLRELAVAQTELEKMARTDGSYGEFGLTFFGRQSKNAVDFRPVYIGGTYQPIVFTEVLQTVQTDDTALGSYAGHGISSSSGGYIGHVECDDYGYIMILASIMPDVYYSQGISRLWTNKLQSEMFLPERARLGLRPILNQELYFSGVAASDEGLFAYQNPFDEYRYLPNVIHGKIADPTELSFFPYTQSRKFSSLPTYSQSFATTYNNIRKDYLFAPREDAYSAQFSLDIRAVRPLPYNPQPAQILN